MYRCSHFSERHTALNIQKAIDESLNELNLSLVDTPLVQLIKDQILYAELLLKLILIAHATG